MRFKVANINCENCVNLIKNSLKDFGDISIDLNTDPKILTLDLNTSKEQEFIKELEELGFEVLGKL